jgi:Na+/proline symporter
MNLHPVDAIVLVVYLIGITVLGAWMGRRVRSAADYFMPRRFGKLTMILHAFGTGTASDQAVTVASATARNGLSGIWYQWMWLFSTPFYWLIAPIMRRFRATTTADVYQLRYNQSVAMLFAIIGIAGMAVKIGVMLKGAGTLIDSGTGGSIDASLAIPIVTILFVVYGIAGGLGGAIMTDFVQGIMTIVFSVMLLPIVLAQVGGLDEMKETIAAAPSGTAMLSLVAPGEIGLFYIAMLSVNTLFLIVAMPSAMGNCAAGRTEMDGRVGFMFGTFIKRVCTIAWCLTALAAVAWYVQHDIAISSLATGEGSIHPDEVYGDMAHRFLPQLLPGMLGIFIASLLAAVMSSCDSFMIASSALFTENIYRVMSPDRSEKHYIWVGRAVSLIVVVIGVAVAFSLPGVIPGLKIWYKVVPMMGIAFWMGLLWRRATPAGAWASAIGGFVAWWTVNQDFFVNWVATLRTPQTLSFLYEQDGSVEIYEPWQIVSYLGTGLIVGTIVSLFTNPIDEDRLDRFYALTRTPIGPDEQHEKPCTLPAKVTPASRAMLLTCFDLEIPRPSNTSLIGFLVGWICVGGLIGGFVWIVS